jgi:hypothetical protein
MAEQMPHSDRPGRGAAEIARLNDWLREHLTAPGNNRVVMTSGIADLIGDVALFRGFRKRAELLRAIRDFDAFDEAVDPYGEHDLGRFEFEGTDCLSSPAFSRRLQLSKSAAVRTQRATASRS